jgi:hypothetical protein
LQALPEIFSPSPWKPKDIWFFGMRVMCHPHTKEPERLDQRQLDLTNIVVM